MSDINRIQNELRELLKKIQHPRFGAVLGLYEETGELAKVIMNWEIYGEKDRDALQQECADVFFSLIDVCNAYQIDLDASCTAKLSNTREHIDQWEKKYGQRLEKLRSSLDKEA